MVVADEVKVAADSGKYGLVRVRSEKKGVRWTVFRRAAIAYIPFPRPSAVSQTRAAFVLELTQAVSPPAVGNKSW